MRFAHGLNGLFLILFGLFGLGVLAIGVLLAVGAERIAASPDGGGSATGYYVAGCIIAIIGLFMMWRTLRDIGAVAMIDVGEDGTWTARSRFGRVVGEVSPDRERRFELWGRELVILAAAVPRRQAIVGGNLCLRSPQLSFRMATSGPHTYDQALRDLGYEDAAPRPGEERIIF